MPLNQRRRALEQGNSPRNRQGLLWNRLGASTKLLETPSLLYKANIRKKRFVDKSLLSLTFSESTDALTINTCAMLINVSHKEV